jgi:hypothetical protein
MDLNGSCMRYKVLKPVNINITAIPDVKSCNLLEKFFYPEAGGRKIL